MVWIKTIDFPDGATRRHDVAMENNVYALETLAAERLNEARATARRLSLVAQVRAPRTRLRQSLGAVLIALGEWLRDTGAGVPARSAVQ